MVADREEAADNSQSDRQASNITVIQVSNKPPHTAIPVLGPETDVFDFNFTRSEPSEPSEHSFVNIVNTEVNVNSENGYGTVFSNDSDYGHLSLTTTVNLTDVRPDDSIKVTDRSGVYERLCMASTSNEAVTKIKKLERVRKSSLPNLEISNSDTTYEYLFPSQSEEINRNATVTVNAEGQNGRINSQNDGNARINPQNDANARINPQNDGNARINTQNDANPRINSENDANGRIHSQENSREVNSNGRNQSTVTVGANMSFNTRALRSSVERSHSQNAYDSAPRARENVCRRVQNSSPKRDGKNDKTEVAPAKPIWKRGLTELSLLTRLRGIGQSRRHQSPTGQEGENDRSATSPAKAVHRSRAEARVDSTRRRSSSLTNGQSPPTSSTALVPLRRRQALSLQAEQRRRAAIPAAVPVHSPPVLAEYDKRVWIAWWGVGGGRCSGRCGDRLAAARGTQPRDLAHARQLFKTSPTPLVDILFHRVPLGKIYVVNKRDQENIGIKLDSECNITSVESQSPAGRAGIPPPGKWAVTEVNNRPINLIKGGEEEMNRLSVHGTEVSVLIQPAPLVKKLRSAIKANKTLLSMR